MDFTLVSLESLVGPTHPESSSGAPYEGISEAKPPKGILGSGFVKQERRGLEGDEWRSSKVSKTVDLSSSSVNKAMQFSQGITNGSPLLESNPLLFSGLYDNYAPQQQQQQHMLSFSSQKPETLPFWGKDSGASAFPYYQRMSTIYSRNAGYGSGSLNASMHVPYAGIRGPFTPSQWIELEHQALIYKYLTSNVPVPSNLLIPLKKSLNPYALSGSSSSPLPPKSWWGSFHLGYGDNTDPEPGRCRRTDGKKWRCSRDAVADQKYCERHINRGRHRSRKPVEGQTGHAASRATTSKVVLPMTSSDSTVMSSAMPIGGASNSLTTITQSGAAAAVANPSTDAAVVNRIQDPRGLSGMSSSSTVNLKSNDTVFNILRQEIVTEGSSHSEFGLVSTDSLLNPSQESSYIDTKNYDTSSFLDFSGQEAQDQLPLHHFIDDWPKDNSDQSVIAWPEDMKSDWINLSMSIPMTSSDFSSSSNSPKHEKLALSPLRLFREFEPEQVNLGPTDELGEAAAAGGGGPKQTNWVPPISWGGSSSMGGPLGEVLTNTSGGNAKASYKNNPSSSLNLLTEGWDGLSPQVGSSPTGVLQKSTFCSLSNSSSESSPRATGHHNRNINSDEASIYDDVLGSTLAASSVPTL